MLKDRRKSSSSIGNLFELSSLVNDDQHTPKHSHNHANNASTSVNFQYRNPISSANSIDRSSQANHDSNSITGGGPGSNGGPGGQNTLKHQFTINSTSDIKEFERKLINLPTFTISDEYARSFFPTSSTSSSFNDLTNNNKNLMNSSSSNKNQVNQCSSVSTEIICVKNKNNKNDEGRNNLLIKSLHDGSSADLSILGTKTATLTTTTITTTTTTTTVVKTAESIPFLVQPLKDEQVKTSCISIGSLSQLGQQHRPSRSHCRNRSRSIISISNDRTERQINSGYSVSKMDQLSRRRKSEILSVGDRKSILKEEIMRTILNNNKSQKENTSKSLKHLNYASRRAESDKQSRRKHSCQIIVENDLGKTVLNTMQAGLSSVSVEKKSTARSLSSIPLWSRSIAKSTDSFEQRRSSSTDYYSMLYENPPKSTSTTIDKIKKSIQNFINSNNESETLNILETVATLKTRNSLGPNELLTISNSFSGIANAKSQSTKSILSHGLVGSVTGENIHENQASNELLGNKLIRKVRSNSSSLFRTVRNSISLGSGHTGITNLKNKKELSDKLKLKDFKKIISRAQKIANTNRSNSEL